VPEEGAFKLATACRGVLGEDEDARSGVGGEFLGRPHCTCFEFCLLMGGAMEFDSCGLRRRGEFAALAPGGKEGTLGGREAIKADKE
jgi:hypothetical protein